MTGVRGIGSFPLPPLEIDVADIIPPLSIREFRGLLFLPLEMLACSPGGVNIFRSAAVVLAVVFLVRALIGTMGGSGVTNRRCVAPVGFSASDFCVSIADVVDGPPARVC